MDNINEAVNADTESSATSQEYKAERIPYNKDEEILDVVTPIKQPEQSADDNAKFAAARREAEAQAKQLRDEQEQTAHNAGWDSWDEMKTYLASQKALADEEVAQAEKESFKTEVGIDPDKLDEIINSRVNEHPSIKQARQKEEQEAILMAISELNGIANTEYTDLSELTSMDNFNEFTDYVTNHGLSLAEAYRLTHDMSLVNIDSKKMNQAGKEHIKAPSMSGASGVADTIPPDVLKEFEKNKKYFPHKTIEDFARLYNRLK